HPLGLAADSSHVYAVWQQNERIELATVDPLTGQHPTTTLTSTQTIAPRVAADTAGDLVVTWVNPGLDASEAVVRPAGGSFSSPTPFSGIGPRSTLAMAPNGTTL